MPTKFKADYFDGRSAGKQIIHVEVSNKGLLLDSPQAEVVQWDFEKIRLLKMGDSRNKLRVEFGQNEENTESLIVSEPEFAEQIIALAPPNVSRHLLPLDFKRKLGFAIGILLIPFVLYFLWVSAIPALSTGLASKVPVSWEEKLGDSVLKSFAPVERMAKAPKTQKALESIIDQLLKNEPDISYDIKIHIRSGSLVNAFALPGGHIVVFQGLLEESDSAEEVAGVLAHELQHILHRHTTQAIIQSLSIYLVFSTLTGDVTGAMQTVLDMAANLGHLSISRNMETEADREGMKLILNSGIDPEGMILFYRKMEKVMSKDIQKASGESFDDEETSSILEYFSTHPLGEERVKLLRQMVRENSGKEHHPLFPDLDWRKMIEMEFPKKEKKKASL